MASQKLRKAVFVATLIAGAVAQAATETSAAKLGKSTADHSKFPALAGPFDSGPAVTKACLTCHTEASKQIHQTQHWKWEYKNPDRSVAGQKAHRQ